MNKSLKYKIEYCKKYEGYLVKNRLNELIVRIEDENVFYTCSKYGDHVLINDESSEEELRVIFNDLYGLSNIEKKEKYECFNLKK